MNHQHVKYLLVGGGVASSAAAGAIRALDPEGSIMLLAQEHVRPYHRPPLSKSFLRRQTRREELFTTPADWFERNRVALRTGRRASRLDTARSSVALDNGEEVSYDRLLIATGASPEPLHVPGSHLPNIYYLRTLDDEERLHHAIEQAKHEARLHPGGPHGRAVIVGAGFLGVELAGTLTQLGLGVDLITTALPWDRFAGETVGRSVARYLESNGVHVHAGSRPLRLEGDGRVQRVVLESGEVVRCDFVFAAVGAAANKDLLRNTSIGAGKSILTDDRCRTSVPDVWAAGDCAAMFDPRFGKHRPVDHWEHALVTGALAGRNMTGANEAFTDVNHFNSEVFDLELHGWGEARLVDRRIVRSASAATGDLPDLIEFGVAADGRVAHVLSLRKRGDTSDHAQLKELVGRRAMVAGIEERLKDPTVPLAELGA